MQIVPRRFCHISTKMSVLWPSENAKIRFWPGLCPGPRWGSSRRCPRHPSRLKSGHPSPYPTPLGTNPPSALAMRSPRIPARSTPMPTGDHTITEIMRTSIEREQTGWEATSPSSPTLLVESEYCSWPNTAREEYGIPPRLRVRLT